jgi:hypothetical protein
VFVFDAQGNPWSRQNWTPGSQSGVARNIGGGTANFSPNGTALSPPITGFTGMGMDGAGWGTRRQRGLITKQPTSGKEEREYDAHWPGLAPRSAAARQTGWRAAFSPPRPVKLPRQHPRSMS